MYLLLPFVGLVFEFKSVILPLFMRINPFVL
ncbi:hypothetical protein FHS16_006116 [Paenibacillus endophyticus]|uniref:Uncharacterized protein n=1 Tax=Paenibacillus endophyticus TaxID=1294268 RepID=A0A7W5CEW4_9BACL|nr:hypothetical protein [Paenibacillus endophyticus]